MTSDQQVAMSIPGTPIERETVIPSDLSAARQLQNEIEEHLLSVHYAEMEIFGIKMAMEEALVNAIKHGNQLDPAKFVTVYYRIHPERFDAKITDEGPGFCPEDVPDPTAPENLERPCGRGLLLMRSFMTDVQFHGRGNSISMSKLRNGTS
jgi:serine/threonine-protein kinase RsbW